MSILTPTILGRENLLAELRASVRAQTFLHWEHLVRRDIDRVGCAKTMNALAAEARGEWLFPIADDDLMLPGCLGALVEVAWDYDVVYSTPLVWGEDGAQFRGDPPGIPAVALIRRRAWEEMGGYNPQLGETEDRDLWERMQQQAKTFCRYEAAPTWVYRFHGGNKSRNHGRAS